MSDTPESAPPVEIPAAALTPEVLDQVVEEFVLREGTDYGDHEVSHAAKVAQVLAQIRRGEVRLFFDPTSESVTLNPRR